MSVLLACSVSADVQVRGAGCHRLLSSHGDCTAGQSDVKSFDGNLNLSVALLIKTSRGASVANSYSIASWCMIISRGVTNRRFS